MGTGMTISDSSSAQFGQSALGIYYHPVFCNSRSYAGVALADDNHLIVDVLTQSKQLLADTPNHIQVPLIVED